MGSIIFCNLIFVTPCFLIEVYVCYFCVGVLCFPLILGVFEEVMNLCVGCKKNECSFVGFWFVSNVIGLLKTLIFKIWWRLGG